MILGDMPIHVRQGTGFAVSGSDLLSEATVTVDGGVLEIGDSGIPDGPIAHWTFDELGNANTLPDTAGPVSSGK